MLAVFRLLVGLVVISSCWAPPLVAQDPQTKQIELTVDNSDPDHKPKNLKVDWQEGMTILDAMKQASTQQPGISFKYRGSGSTVFITQIDGLKNEGGKGKNWIFRVNGKLGDRSAGVFRLKPGDRVLWKFGKYR